VKGQPEPAFGTRKEGKGLTWEGKREREEDDLVSGL